MGDDREIYKFYLLKETQRGYCKFIQNIQL